MAIRKKLGEILIDQGLISDIQLHEALSGLKECGLKLGEYLIQNNIVSEHAILDAIASQMNLKKYNPNDYILSPELSKIMDVDTVNKLNAIPVEKNEGVLTVAMVDPLNIIAIDYIEVMTNMEVETIICSEQNFTYLMSGLYGAYSGKDGVMKQVQDIAEMEGELQEDEYLNDSIEATLHDMAEEGPVVKLVNSILSQAVREGATDIHLSPEKDYVEIRFRVDGKLHKIPSPPKRLFLPMISRIKILANLDISVSRIPQDGRMTIVVNENEINIRVSTIPTVYGENMVMRLLDTSSGIHSLDKLGFMHQDIQALKKMIKMPYGMILCTGPTGSGKSTSLFSMLKEINSPDTNIITLEDPVEYRMEHVRQVQLNHKAGMSFASGLRSILRQDPDVIMVGEIRDKETASVAAQAALTGHLVFSTVHTNDAVGAIARFVDMGIEPFMVASVLLVVIAQRLVRRACPYCKESYTPSSSILEYWQLEDKPYDFVKANGCSQCMNTGYKGRVGFYEILYVNDDVRQMILDGKSAREIFKFTLETGLMKSLKFDAVQKVVQGITTSEEAMSAILVK
ncbi:GspE/PulE family protein [Desulfobacula toluolica]|uniref:GspE: putative general secretion pathway protein E n=1 Tax=Desulfobacula toluolica (strain DSM 7467 / Tol2) TaxID=651182 RepID=K0NGC8_DESTT|nr:GspE/PulE family protein [Desulfobacula toluolica]CCK78873.1 GspE: putative general secretion pathway protein E [Desulfobacula toluolica Tol2]